MEIDDVNPTIDHEQKPRQYIGVRSNKQPKTNAERAREFRARKALLKQQTKQQKELDAVVIISTEDIQSTGSSDNQGPGPSEIRTIDKRAKSAEATRRWREKKKGSESLKKQAKTAAQRMREYRKRKKLLTEAPETSAERALKFRTQKAPLKQQTKQQHKPDVIVSTDDIRSAGSSEDDQVPGPSEIRTIDIAKSAEATRRWREKQNSESSKTQAKTAAQRMREYRERKKFKNDDCQPGPSGIANPGKSGSDISGPEKRKRATRRANKDTASVKSVSQGSGMVEFVSVLGAPDTFKQEITDEYDMPLEENMTCSVPGILKHSREVMDQIPNYSRVPAKKLKPSEDIDTELNTSEAYTSEIMIKDEPTSYETILEPSVIYGDGPVNQEVPLVNDTNKSMNYVIEYSEYQCVSTDATDNIKSEAESNTDYDFHIRVIKQESTDLNCDVEDNTLTNTAVIKIEAPVFNASTNSTYKIDFHSVDDILNDLIKNKFITPSEKNTLATYKLSISLLQDYSPSINFKLKSFAIALYVYSHKAYEFVRDKYKTGLPPPSAVRDWLVQTKGKAGFTRETIEAINAKVAFTKQKTSESHKIFVCLVLKDIKMCSRRYGNAVKVEEKIINPLECSISAAYAALVMTAVALNADWKLPIGYFWTNIVKGSERANLVNIAINILETVGVEPIAVYFDHNQDNLDMCTGLNCNISGSDLKTSFISESGRQIFIFPDLRTTLEVINTDISYTETYIDESLQVVSLTQLPLLMQHAKMQPTTPNHALLKIIAVELCKDERFSFFEPAAGILTFLKNIHIVLDALSSRKGGLLLKEPIPMISNVTAHPTVVALQEAGKYFKSLRLNGSMKPVWSTVEGTGILGICGLIDSALMMICKYSNKFSIQFGKFIGNSSYFLTNFVPPAFDRRRSSAAFFQKKYKLMLQKVAQLKLENNPAIECVPLLTSKCAFERINQTVTIPKVNIKLHIEDDLSRLLACQIKEYEDMFVVYIARFVTYSLTKNLQCYNCVLAVRSRPYSSIEPFSKHSTTKAKLNFDLKSEEPSTAVMHICKTAESIYKKARDLCGVGIPNFNVFSLVIQVMKKYVERPLFEDLMHHQFDTDQMCNHVVDLTKAVAEIYLDIRIKHWARNKWRPINLVRTE